MTNYHGQPLRGVMRAALMGLVLAGLTTSFAACQQNDRNKLWSDEDPSTDWRLKRYYDDDSARAGTAKMNRQSEMGFAIPGLGGG